MPVLESGTIYRRRLMGSWIVLLGTFGGLLLLSLGAVRVSTVDVESLQILVLCVNIATLGITELLTLLSRLNCWLISVMVFRLETAVTRELVARGTELGV